MERSDGLKGLLENSPSTRNSTTFLSRIYVLRRDEKASIVFPKFARLFGLKQVPRWEDLDKDILAFIFNKLDVMDLTMGASRVCFSWFLASHNKTLWNTVDLTKLQQVDVSLYSPIFWYKIPLEGLSLRNLLINKIILFFLNSSELEESNLSFKNLLTILIKNLFLSGLEEGSISLEDLLIEITKLSGTLPKNLIFNFSSVIVDTDLIFAAERMPNIEKLVLPAWYLQENSVLFATALSQWKNLKTLIVACNLCVDGEFDFKTVGVNCSNLTNFKYLGHLRYNIAEQIVLYLKNLKRLSLRRSPVSSAGVLLLITGLPNLVVLNLSHCQEFGEDGGPVHIENLVQVATQNLVKYILCSQNDCRICKDQQQRGFSFRYCSKDWQNDEIKEFEF